MLLYGVKKRRHDEPRRGSFFAKTNKMLAFLKAKQKHDWTRAGSWLSSTANPGYYYISISCRNCWWTRSFIVSPHIHDDLEGKTSDEFFDGIEDHVLAGKKILFSSYYHVTNPWQPYYKDTRRNPHCPYDCETPQDTLLLPSQLSELGREEKCHPWTKEQTSL